MSEFLATARIIVRPDTTAFRAELEAQLAAVTKKPIAIPVVPVVGANLAAATSATAGLTSAQNQAVVSTQALAAGQEKLALSETKATAATTAHTRSLSQLARGAGASGLTLFGLRGATLAASGAFLAGTAAVVAFSRAVQSAAALQTELNVFRVAAGATADEMKRAAEEAQSLGRDLTLPGVTAGDAAEAMTQLAKAGLSVQDSLAATRGTLQLATAAQIDNVAATGLVASALNSFALAGGEAVRVADLLTGAAKESQGEITDMGTALQQASAVAKLAGINLEDTVTFLTQLARAGISGGRAGTSLRVAILRLINPTETAAAKLKELNVQIRDSQGNVREQVFTDIAAALQTMSRAQQQATLATIFGTDAVRAAAIIGNEGAISYQNLRDAITEAGLAQQQAAARTSGFSGSIENLKNQFESLGTSVGKFVIGPGKALADFFATTVSDANSLIGVLTALNDKSNEFDRAFNERVFGSQDTGEKIGETLRKGILGGLRAGPVLVDVAIDQAKVLREAAETNREVHKILTGPGTTGEKNIQVEALLLETKDAAGQVRKEIDQIFAAGRDEGGDRGLNQVLVNLDALVGKLKDGGPSAQKFADSVQQVRDSLFAAQGFKLFPDNIRDLFPQDLLPEFERVFAEAGAKGGVSFADNLAKNAIPGTKTQFVPFTNAIVDAAQTAADKVKIIMSSIVRDATNQLGALDEAVDEAVAAGDRKGQLEALKKQAAEQQRILDAADKAAKTIGSGNKGFATAVATRREARDKLASLNTQIRSIEDSIAADAQKTANDVKEARNKADQAFLDSIGFREGELQNQILRAAADKGLANDIARNEALRDFYKRKRAEAAKTIKDAELEADTIQGLTTKIININATIEKLVQQQIDAQNESRRKQKEALKTSLQLDIDFSQANNNVSGEIKARLALIKQLEKDKALATEGTVAWKELRNQIAAETEAIKELQGEKKKQNNAFGQASFEFLQTQAGFASSLLGNLIPRGLTGGLVGGGAPVQSALQPVVGMAEASSQGGPTAGQAQTTNAKLEQILEQLKAINGVAKAPEAARHWQAQRNTMDGSPLG